MNLAISPHPLLTMKVDSLVHNEGQWINYFLLFLPVFIQLSAVMENKINMK